MAGSKPEDEVRSVVESDLSAEAQRQAERSALKARRTADDLRGKLRATEHELTLAEERLTALLAMDSVTDGYVIEPRKRTGDGEAVAFAVASDWHVEEVIRPEQVSGLNTHNLSISEKKIKSFYQRTVTLIRHARHGRDVRVLVHPLLGDFFSGHIHEDLIEVTELTPTESVLWLETRIAAGIRHLLEHADLDRIVIPCCIGNHGRTTRKPRISTAQKHSYEWILYHHLARMFEGEKRVKFLIADGYHLMLEAAGMAVRLHHGDALKYAGGVGGLTIPLNKALSAWNLARRVDLDVLGHWRQLLWLPRAIVNGSLIGYGPFSVAIKAEFEPPAQAFFVLDAKYRRRTIQAPIFLE